MPEGLPSRPLASNATSEPLVQPLVLAGLTESWRPALNLLYFHSSLLALSEEIGLPIFVSLRGDTSGLSQVSELLTAQTGAELGKVTRSWTKEVVPRILQAAKEGRAGVTPGEIGAALGAQAAKEGGPAAKLIQDLIRRAFQDAVTFSGGFSAFVFEFLVSKRTAHLTNVLPEAEYERMVDLLHRLNLLEPRIEVSICPSCRNHYFVVSDHPATPTACTKCGRRWVTVELFVLTRQLSQIELGSSLMALYISAYLRGKVNAQSPMIDLEIFPNAEFELGPGRRLEVDVYVPRAALGYECKAFEDVFAPITGSRLGSVVGRVLPQLQGYLELGVENLVVATNLPAASADRVRRELGRKLEASTVKPKSVVVLPGNPNALAQHLDDLATSIAAKLNKDFADSFEAGSKAKGKRPPPTRPATGR